jgi:protein ImuB
MHQRFVTIWFRHLVTDWWVLRRPALKDQPFVLAGPERGRMVIRAANGFAQSEGIGVGMVVADARAMLPGLEVLDDQPERAAALLRKLGEWCIRYTPLVAVDLPDGLILDVTGCAHLWGGEEPYLRQILTRLRTAGYDVRGGMADTIGAARAIARFGKRGSIVETGRQLDALLPLPPAALRLEEGILLRLRKLGLFTIQDFVRMPRSVLRRRFGTDLLYRIDQAMGRKVEMPEPLQPPEAYRERLPCPEPIVTATGIGIALRRLLDTICERLVKEGKGLRSALFMCYRIDGKLEQIDIGTNRPSRNASHLFKLFELKIPTIEPALGIELFVLEAPKVEEVSPLQEMIWGGTGGLEDVNVAELLDRLTGRLGKDIIHRFLPDEHYWPERSFKKAAHLEEKPTISWPVDRPRPIRLLARPEPVEVAAPIPDYPPMLFRYKGTVHKIVKADGPERIEREWWLEQGPHRDYYRVEDEAGRRYWIYRSGHYTGENPHGWFLHGFFA